MAYTKKNQLIDRIENNYANFKFSLKGVSRQKLFEMAGRIAAVTEAYEMLRGDYGDWDDEIDVEFYLMFRDPLTIIADAWESRRNEMTVDFDGALFDIENSDTTISQYPLMEGVADGLNFDGEYDETIRFESEI